MSLLLRVHLSLIMRLLNTETIELHEFFEDDVPRYAILSHRWEADEITFKDVMKRRSLKAAGWRKIKNFCDFVRKYGYEWAWVDTCCIDKRSSAELSEAINSMYKLYQNLSSVCFAYLNDVQCQKDDIRVYQDLQGVFQSEPTDALPDRIGEGVILDLRPKQCSSSTASELRASRWFTRGWTLQELIAPKQLYFVDRNWNLFGSKSSLNDLVSQITGINDVTNVHPKAESIAIRMSWASRRECKRPEDEAYSLMGLFDVNMPLIYGEGAQKAFLRLQLEILKRSNDESIFAWSHGFGEYKYRILARSPRSFSHSSNIKSFRPTIPREPYTMTNKGLEITTILLPAKAYAQEAFMPLNCYREGEIAPLALRLRRLEDDSYIRYSTHAGKDRLLSWPEKTDLEEEDHYELQKIYVQNELGLGYIKAEFDIEQQLRSVMDEYLPDRQTDLK